MEQTSPLTISRLLSRITTSQCSTERQLLKVTLVSQIILLEKEAVTRNFNPSKVSILLRCQTQDQD